VTGNAATILGGGIYNFGDDSTVTIDAGALICGNTGFECSGNGAYNGTCPNPADGTCPA
jgi:hypothetical protein